MKLLKNCPKNFPDLSIPIIITKEGTYVGYKERLYKYFEIPPKHNLTKGDLVTCTCHGGLAIIVKFYDKSENHPSMDMAQIYWIKLPHDGVKERLWVHTISKLKECK